MWSTEAPTSGLPGPHKSLHRAGDRTNYGQLGKPHLALLAHKEEDRFTEYLGQLLLSRAALSVFIETLDSGIRMDEPSMLDVHTQVTVPGGVARISSSEARLPPTSRLQQHRTSSGSGHHPNARSLHTADERRVSHSLPSPSAG